MLLYQDFSCMQTNYIIYVIKDKNVRQLYFLAHKFRELKLKNILCLSDDFGSMLSLSVHLWSFYSDYHLLLYPHYAVRGEENMFNLNEWQSPLILLYDGKSLMFSYVGKRLCLHRVSFVNSFGRLLCGIFPGGVYFTGSLYLSRSNKS